MDIEGKRPRELEWYHAGPMLFGDWGTSRLYVLGLAFYFTQRSSLYFMLAMSLLLIGVGWAYQIICRIYPDGGGVYSSARHRSQLLAVIGGLLLCADYVVTAALSALDAFHYLNLPDPHIWAAASIALIGAVNYFGPRKAGTGALVIALLTVLFTLAIALAAAPYLSHVRVEPPRGGPLQWWSQFTLLILAISGVEAVANMTGIMVRPVERTARRAIWPVLIEIVVLNLILTLAMLAVPDSVLGDGDPSKAFTAHQTDMLRVLASYYIGPVFAAIASLVFALLLLSAVNTAVTDLVSIQFMMSRDRELPSIFAALNNWGMPLVSLVVGTAVPLVIVIAVPSMEELANLYAIGVVGAVAINLGTCSTNFSIALGKWERGGMMLLAALMIVIWFTIAIEKPQALLFAMSIMGLGLLGRWSVRNREQIRGWMLAPVAHPLMIAETSPAILPARKIEVSSPVAARAASRVPARKVMVATRGNEHLLQFAVQEARNQEAELFVLYVRHVAIATMGPANVADANLDPEAVAVFELAKQHAAAAGVVAHCLYALAWDIPEAILEMAATHAVDVLILGTTQRGALWHVMKGDVIQQVGQYLPERISLLIHA